MFLISCLKNEFPTELVQITKENKSNIFHNTHPWTFSKSNLKSDRINFVAPASPIECLLYLPNVRAIQCKMGPERLTRLGNSNVQQLPVTNTYILHFKVSLQYNYIQVLVLASWIAGQHMKNDILASEFRVSKNFKEIEPSPQTQTF